LAGFLRPANGDGRAAAITHETHAKGLTLGEAALRSGLLDGRRYDELVDPRSMVGRGVEGA
jgi:fumarate hydratase class II